MADSLEGARLKLVRAREHLETLGSELAAFTTGEPYRIVHEPNKDGSEHVFRARVVKEPPPVLSVIIGDALQNIRSALEHLAWGLAIKHTGPTPPRSTTFPIHTQQSTFFEAGKGTGTYAPWSGKRKIAALSQRAQWAVQELQPYNAKEPDKHPLVLLHELARVDRHQSLSVMGGLNRSVTYGWRKRGTRGPFVMDPKDIREHATVQLGPFEDGKIIGHFVLREPDMEVDFQAPRYVAFRDAGPASGLHVMGTLTTIRRHVERVVVRKLERHF